MAESWLNEEEETQTSTVSEFTGKEILKELKKNREEASLRFDSLDSANKELIRLQRELNKKTNKIGELNNKVEEVLGLLRGDDISSKRVNSIYNLEMALAVVILVSTAIFYKVLGLMAIPMIILGLGIFFTSFRLKSKIKEMRKEYGI